MQLRTDTRVFINQSCVEGDDLIPEKTRHAISIEGQDIALQCDCTKSECRNNSTATYWRNKWLQLITPSNKYLTTQRMSSNGITFSMTILNTSVEDQGTYWCGVNTSLGFDFKKRRLQILTKGSPINDYY